MQFHHIKMEEINKIIKELWVNTYCGSGASPFGMVSSLRVTPSHCVFGRVW